MVNFAVKHKNAVTDLDVSGSTITVAEIKAAIASKLDIPANQQRLVQKGKILSDDAATYTTEDLEGQQIHVVRTTSSVPAAAQPAAPQSTGVPNRGPQPEMPDFSKMFSPEGMEQMMGMVEGIFGGNNKGGLEGLGGMLDQFMKDPAMKDTLAKASEMAQKQMAQNPEFIERMFQNDTVKNGIQNILGEDIGDLGQFVSQMQSDGGSQIQNILNDPSLMENLPDIMDKSLEYMKGITPTGEGGDVPASITDLLKGVIGDKHAVTSSTSATADSSPNKMADADPAMQSLIDLGFADHSLNAELMQKHGNDLDKVIADLLNR